MCYLLYHAGTNGDGLMNVQTDDREVLPVSLFKQPATKISADPVPLDQRDQSLATLRSQSLQTYHAEHALAS